MTILLLLVVSTVNASDSTFVKHNNIGLCYQQGYIGDPDYFNSHLINNYTRSFQLSYEWYTNGYQQWHRFYNYPRIGVLLQHINLGSSELGTLQSLTPYLTFHAPNNRKYEFSLKLGLGLAYTNTSFHHLENYKNTLLGSHFNANLYSAFEAGYYITKRIKGFAGASIQHFSNGNTVIPNLGLNIFSLHTGINYSFQQQKKPYHFKVFQQKKTEVNLIYTLSVTNRRNNIQTGFHYQNFMVEATRIYKESLAYGIGIDLTINNSDSSHIKIKTDFVEVNREIGLKAIVGAVFGNFEMLLQPGIILYPEKRGYTWLSFRYQFTQRIKADLQYRYYLFNGNHLSFGLCFTVF